MQVPATAEDVAYYEPPDPKVPISGRINRSTNERMKGLIRHWKNLAESRGEAPDEIDFAYVLNRLLKTASLAAWEEAGGMPEDEEGWKKLEAATAKTAKSTKR